MTEAQARKLKVDRFRSPLVRVKRVWKVFDAQPQSSRG